MNLTPADAAVYLREFSAQSSAQRQKSLPKYSDEVSAELSVKPPIWIDSYSRGPRARPWKWRELCASQRPVIMRKTWKMPNPAMTIWKRNAHNWAMHIMAVMVGSP